MDIYCDAAYRFSQIGLVGDEDDVYLFQCLLQEAIYLDMCDKLNQVEPKPLNGMWEFSYPRTVKFIGYSVEVE